MTIITATLPRTSASMLPDALRPSSLPDIWNGTFGSGGLRAEVTATSSNLVLDGKGGLRDAGAQAQGSVLRGEDVVGSFTREVKLDRDGRMGIHHEYLKLDEDAQGTGFARAFNEHAFARYADAGIERVTIEAGLDVGGYAWARQGFELLTLTRSDVPAEVQRGSRLTSFILEAYGKGRLTDDDLIKLMPRLVRGDQAPAQALESVQELAAMPNVGRNTLLGQSWSGVREIDTTSPWWQSMSPFDDRHGMALLRPSSVDASQARRMLATTAGKLPPAIDLAKVEDVFLKRLPGSKTERPAGGPDIALRFGAGDALEAVDARTSIVVDGKLAYLTTELSETGGLVGRESFWGTLDDRARANIDGGWRDLGVRTVFDENGVGRSIEPLA